MNIHWFQPYKHLTYSVGVIYLTIMNLPCSLRYKRENVLLVGIIPGPHEPSHDINSYLDPLVKNCFTFGMEFILMCMVAIKHLCVVRYCGMWPTSREKGWWLLGPQCPSWLFQMPEVFCGKIRWNGLLWIWMQELATSNRKETQRRCRNFACLQYQDGAGRIWI